MKKRESKKEEIYTTKERIIISLTAISLALWIIPTIITKYHPDFSLFLSTLNPFVYLSSLKVRIIFSHLKEIFFLLVFLFSTISAGKMLERVMLFKELDISLLYGAGLIFNSFIVLVTGFLGYISKDIYLGIIVAEAVGGIYLLIKKDFKINYENSSKRSFFLSAGSILLLLLSFIVSLSPEIFYDSLNYHLSAPNYWIINSKISDMPAHIYHKLPLNHSLIYTMVLTIFSEQTPLLVNFSTFIFFLLFIIHSFKRYLNPHTLLTAAFIFLSIFHVYVMTQSAGGDIISSFTAALAFKMILNYLEKEQKIDLIWAGIFSGFAFCSKYNTAFVTLSFFFILLYKQIKNRKSFSRIFKEVLFFSIGFLIFTTPWLVKNLIKNSNPLFPFAHEIFCRRCQSDEIKRAKALIDEIKQNEGLNVISWIKLPYLVSVGRIANSELFLPLFLIILPLAVFNKRKNEFITLLWFSFIFSYLLWSTSTTYIRHFFSSYFIISILAAYYINDAFDGFARSIIKMIFAITMFINTILLVDFFAIEKRYEPVFGMITKDEYLSTSRMRYPYPSYSMYKYINENLTMQDKILIFGDSRTFYLKIPHETASVFDLHPLVKLSQESKDGDEIYLKLKEKGFTHIMLNLTEGYRTKVYGNLYFSPEEFKRFDDFFKKHLLVEKEIEEKDKTKIILYLLVERKMVYEVNYFSYFIRPQS